MTASSIIEYIDGYDGDVRQRLLTVYELIRSAVPDEAVESISWRMPTFRLPTRSRISRQSWPHMEPPNTLSSCAMMPRYRSSCSAR